MPPRSTKRQFSTASLRVLANDIDNHVDPTAVDSVLRNLANIDRQIHDDFNAVRADLADVRRKHAQAQKDLEQQRTRCAALEQENTTLKTQLTSISPNNTSVNNHPRSQPLASTASKPLSSAICNCRPKHGDDKVSPRFFLRDHAPSCALRCALLAALPPDRLCDLVLAREDAWRNQQILVDRLKLDNRLLCATYDNLWSRYQALHNQRRCDASDSPSSSLPTDNSKKISAEESNVKSAKNTHELANKSPKVTVEPDSKVKTPAKAKPSEEVAVPDKRIADRPRSGKGPANNTSGKPNEVGNSAEQRKDSAVVGADKLEYLSLRVAHAGKAAVDIASRVEERLKLTARDVSNFRQSLSQAATSQTSSLSNSPIAQLRSPTLSMRVTAPTTPRSLLARSRNALSISAANIDMIDSPAPTPPSSCVPWRRRGVRDEYDTDDLVSEFADNNNGKQAHAGETQEKKINTENGYEHATDELMRTMALQQDAHEQLRATVVELTAELARIDPALLADASRSHQRAQETQQKLDDAFAELKRKDDEIVDLRRQLTKVIAEYEAVSVAHSYSNAELSKIRANNRERTKHDQRQGGEGRSYARALNVLETIENNKHHRRIHFRWDRYFFDKIFLDKKKNVYKNKRYLLFKFMFFFYALLPLADVNIFFTELTDSVRAS